MRILLPLLLFAAGCSTGEHTATLAVSIWGIEPKCTFVSKDITFGCRKIVVTNVNCNCQKDLVVAGVASSSLAIDPRGEDQTITPR